QVVITIPQIATTPITDWDYEWTGVFLYRNWTKSPFITSDTIVVTYPSHLPFVGHARNESSIADVGLYSEIIEAGQITDRTQLQTIADEALARGAERDYKVDAITRTSGFVPGQLLTINTTNPPVNGQFIIQSVSSQEIAQDFMRHQITATSTQYQ